MFPESMKKSFIITHYYYKMFVTFIHMSFPLYVLIFVARILVTRFFATMYIQMAFLMYAYSWLRKDYQ